MGRSNASAVCAMKRTGAMSARQICLFMPHPPLPEAAAHAAGASVAPGPSERCIITESVQRPNLKPIEDR